jgi:D-amino-acid oxidase
MRVIVIGCGVSGLSTGIRLVEAGHEVEIWARDLPPNTTSNIAAAIWHPYRAGGTMDRLLAWSQRSLDVLYGMVGIPEAAVRTQEVIEVFREPQPEPWWSNTVRGFRFLRPGELPAGFGGGFFFETVVVETRIYLPYLMRRLGAPGGQIKQRDINSLDEALAEASVVVNCAGLGARTLVDDAEMFPVRGQIMRVAKPALQRSMLDEEEDANGIFAYIIPRSQDCVLGGTAQAGNWSLEPDPAIAAEIMERCARLYPQIRQAAVLEHLVGLRPGRSSVRLEAERLPNGLVVHNYGHGGAGITLSWGCAEEVAGLVESLT